jgi:importin subunit beta-1
MLSKIRAVEIEDDCEEDDEWGVQTSAGCCLQKLSLLLGAKVIPQVVEFVQANISSADWQGRYAALIALGAITEVPDKRAIGEILAGSLSMLLNMFQDSSIKVREAISWVISKVCEHHGDVLTQTSEGTTFVMQMLMSALKDKPKVSKNTCAAIEKLSESLQPSEPNQQSNALTPYL